jgi:YggT family protein
MLTLTVYPWVFLAIWALFGLFAIVLVARMVLAYADPNPFGALGRFSFKLRRSTERFVYPAARFLATYRISPSWAPLLTALIALVFTYFLTQIVGNTFFVIDGLSAGVATGRPMVFIGFAIYGLLSLLVLFIFIRFISTWFVFTRNTFLAFVRRVTDPILIPVQRLIPPIGMFDISAMLLLILIGFLQSMVLRIFVYS